jgi:HEAT repeat protein
MASKANDLQETLKRLSEQPGALPFSRLYTFSDLADEDLASFCAVWDTFPTVQRQRLAHSLVELAEASFQVNFDAIFVHCLDDPDGIVRAAAIDGLWENKDTALLGRLLSVVRNDPSALARAAAAMGLGRFVLAGELEELEPPVQARILTELLTTIHLADESIDVRRRAVESVAYACTPEVAEVLELAYYDEDEEMRLSAIVGMGRSCDDRWKDVILTEIESTSAAMRYEAALACGGLMLREAVPILTRLLEDADPQIRDASIWSLGQIGGGQAKQALMAAYEDADEDTRVILDEALAEQALSEGSLEFLLYEIDEEGNDDLFGDEVLTLWSQDDDIEDEQGRDDWDLL